MNATPSPDPSLPKETQRFVHDLRNCLAAMRAGASMLHRSADQPAIVEKVADGLYVQVAEMLALVDKFIGCTPRTSEETGVAHGSAIDATDERPLRILIADDNADAANTLATYLRLSGHRPVVALDGGQALQLASDEAPDVMLLDLSMPTLDGYEVARRVRSQSWGAALRLIAVSGWFSTEDIDRAMQAGFDAHISKPIDMDALPRMLQVAH